MEPELIPREGGTPLRGWVRALVKETLPACLMIVFGLVSTLLTFFPHFASGRLRIVAVLCLAVAFAWANLRVYRKMWHELAVLKDRLSAFSIKAAEGWCETTVLPYQADSREAREEEARDDTAEQKRQEAETDIHIHVPICIVNKRTERTSVRLLAIRLLAPAINPNEQRVDVQALPHFLQQREAKELKDGMGVQESSPGSDRPLSSFEMEQPDPCTMRIRKLYFSSPSIGSAGEPRTMDLNGGQTLLAAVEVYVSGYLLDFDLRTAEGELRFEETFAGSLEPVPFTAGLVDDW